MHTKLQQARMRELERGVGKDGRHLGFLVGGNSSGEHGFEFFCSASIFHVIIVINMFTIIILSK